MVADANTVVDPRTVVIEALDTLVADAAMTGPICSYYFTVGTEQDGIELFQHRGEIHVCWLFDESWVRADCHNVEEESDKEQGQLNDD